MIIIDHVIIIESREGVIMTEDEHLKYAMIVGLIVFDVLFWDCITAIFNIATIV